MKEPAKSSEKNLNDFFLMQDIKCEKTEPVIVIDKQKI